MHAETIEKFVYRFKGIHGLERITFETGMKEAFQMIYMSPYYSKIGNLYEGLKFEEWYGDGKNN